MTVCFLKNVLYAYIRVMVYLYFVYFNTKIYVHFCTPGLSAFDSRWKLYFIAYALQLFFCFDKMWERSSIHIKYILLISFIINTLKSRFYKNNRYNEILCMNFVFCLVLNKYVENSLRLDIASETWGNLSNVMINNYYWWS